MASVQKRTKSGYYAFFRGKHGRRCCRKTGSRNRQEAQRIADAWELEARQGSEMEGPRLRNTEAVHGPRCTGSAVEGDDTRYEVIPVWTGTCSSIRQARRLSGGLVFTLGARSQGTGARNAQNTSHAGYAAVREQRMKQLAEAVRRQQDAEGRAKFREHFAIIHGGTLVTARPPTMEEHTDLVCSVWEDFVKRKEPGAWGQCWISGKGEICRESFGLPILHTAIPNFPQDRPREGSIPVVVRFNPEHIGESQTEFETETAASADGILQSRLFAGGLPSESDPRILDGPFSEMDVMEKDAHDFLRRTQDDDENQSTAREVAVDVIVAIALCRQKACHIFSYSNQSGEEWGALWLYFTAACMYAAARHEEMKAMASRRTQTAAATARKLIEGKCVGGQKAEKREQLISRMVEVRRSNPEYDSVKALAELGIKRASEDSLYVFEVSGIGLRKLSTLRACWTEAGAILKKASRSPRDIESSG